MDFSVESKLQRPYNIVQSYEAFYLVNMSCDSHGIIFYDGFGLKIYQNEQKVYYNMLRKLMKTN